MGIFGSSLIFGVALIFWLPHLDESRKIQMLCPCMLPINTLKSLDLIPSYVPTSPDTVRFQYMTTDLSHFPPSPQVLQKTRASQSVLKPHRTHSTLCHGGRGVVWVLATCKFTISQCLGLGAFLGCPSFWDSPSIRRRQDFCLDVASSCEAWKQLKFQAHFHSLFHWCSSTLGMLCLGFLLGHQPPHPKLPPVFCL